MGYYTYGTGWVHIDPPIPASVLAGLDTGCLACPVVETRTDHADGSYTVIPTIPRIQPPAEDGWRAYDVAGDLQRIVDRIHEQQGAGVAFTGHIYGEGEESDDVWRASVETRDGSWRAEIERATLHWPDGSEVDRAAECGTDRLPWL